MTLTNPFLQQLGIARPILQAPMAGGPTTPALVAAVCEAGGLGFLAAAYSTPEQIAAMCAEVRQRTAKPFGINLFAPTPAPAPPQRPETALDALRPYHAELGIEPPSLPSLPGDTFPGQLDAVLESHASVFSFTFGIPPADALQAVRSRGMTILGTATTVEEAVALERAGVDAVVAQGSEAGAHRGTFLGSFESSLIGTMALVPQVMDAVRVPVVASGGIMDGRGVAAALCLGASAVQMGTAFLACPESGTADAYRDAIFAAREDETRITRAFSGRAARGIVNRFMLEVERADAQDAVLPYPLQNALTRPLRTAAGKAGRPEFLSLWAGQGLRLATRLRAGDLVEKTAKEAEDILSGLNPLRRARTTP